MNTLWLSMCSITSMFCLLSDSLTVPHPVERPAPGTPPQPGLILPPPVLQRSEILISGQFIYPPPRVTPLYSYTKKELWTFMSFFWARLHFTLLWPPSPIATFKFCWVLDQQTSVFFFNSGCNPKKLTKFLRKLLK